MQFRRSGVRDDRRRRALIDESNDESNGQSPQKKHAEGSPKGYTAEAKDARQARVTDLIPKRHWVLAVLALTGMVCIGLLALLHLRLSNGAATIADAQFAAFDVSAPASVSVWLSSFLLIVAAGVCLQIYALRRYKEDDYRGCYRVWLWSAAIFLLASIDATAKLHVGLQGSLVRLTGTTLYGDGRIWALIAGGIMFGGFAIRLLIETRHCFKSLALGLKAATAYGTSAALFLGVVTLVDPATTALIQSTSLVSGHFLVLLSLWYYARHVYLDAHGQLASQKPSTKKQAASESVAQNDQAANESGDSTPSRLGQKDLDELEQIEESFDEEPRSRKKLKEKRSKPRADVLSMQSEDDHDEGNEYRSKSKADRRRERKVKDQQRRAA